MKFLLAAWAAFALAIPAMAADHQDILAFTVDRSDRKVYVRRGAEMIATHDVAVGKEGHETPIGDWQIHQVDINPDWTRRPANGPGMRPILRRASR